MKANLRDKINVNTFRKANPFIATVVTKSYLVDNGEENQVVHISITCDGFDFSEGQSIGIVAPGENEKGKTHAVRLYSIASISKNTQENISTLDICVKRLVYVDENGNKKYGVCSNYICDAKIGDTFNCTGPAGRHFVLPFAEEVNRPYIFIATGTGIAPFRAKIKKLLEYVPNFNEPVHLIFGAQYSKQLLYNEEFSQYKNINFHYYTALSREEKTASGDKMYVDKKLQAELANVWKDLINPRTLIYLCGIKGMEEGIEKVIKEYATTQGIDANSFWQLLQHRLKKEVY